MFRQRITRFVVLSLAAASLAIAHQPTPAGADHDTTYITFEGGGFGHGVGMSQYGALGRAEAGHSADEILSFYYDGTTVEDRTADLESLLGDGIRVRLSPAYQSSNRPDGVTVTARDPDHQVSVTFGEQTHTGNSIYLEQAGQVVGSSNGITDGDEEWLWIVKVDGGEDVCVGCQASSATIVRPEGAIIDIVDDVGSQGAHDAGDVTLIGRDTASGDSPDTVFVVLQLPLEDYLHGIDEVPHTWPASALEAQAIAARSYATAQAISRRSSGWSFDVYDSVQDQVYDGYEDANGNFTEHPSRLDAVLATAGQVVVYDHEIVRTFYSSSNGGYTAASEDSFVTAEPFHIAKPDPFDAALDENGDPQNPFPSREFSNTREALSRWLTRDNMDVGIVQSNTIDDPVPSGRVNDVTATIVGSTQTRTVSASALRWAIVNGCNEDDGDPEYDFECDDYPRSSHLRLKKSFVDVTPGQFFYDGVSWMTTENITQGTSATEFSPWRIISRAETGTLIWRFMGEPSAAEPSVFDDVPTGAFYASAVDWMVEAGVTSGTTDTTFSPHQPVTRGQFATFLWRLVGKPIVESPNDFEDVAEGKFYTRAVTWMVFHEVTFGTTATTFSPYDPLTRGQIATFLYRLAAKPEAFAEGVELPDKMRS